jgi:hypothetical protein
MECTCDSDFEDDRTPVSWQRYRSSKKGQGYKHRPSYYNLIQSLRHAHGLQKRRALIATAPDSFIRFLANLSRKLVSGAIRVNSKQRQRLRQYGPKLVQFAKTKNINQLRRRASTGGKSQKGGLLPIIPLLLGLGPLLAKGLAVGAASALGGTIVKKIVDSGKNESQVPQTGSGAYRRSQYYY